MVRNLIKGAISCISILLLTVCVYAQEKIVEEVASDKVDVKRITTLLETDTAVSEMFGRRLKTIREAFPDVPENVWGDIMAEVDMEKFFQIFSPIYEKYFTDEEIKEIILFYESPLGTKMKNTLPKIKEESLRAGAQWQSEVVSKVMQKLAAEGYKPDSSVMSSSEASKDIIGEVNGGVPE